MPSILPRNSTIQPSSPGSLNIQVLGPPSLLNDLQGMSTYSLPESEGFCRQKASSASQSNDHRGGLSEKIKKILLFPQKHLLPVLTISASPCCPHFHSICGPSQECNLGNNWSQAWHWLLLYFGSTMFVWAAQLLNIWGHFGCQLPVFRNHQVKAQGD
jgi:hypothetical protein